MEDGEWRLEPEGEAEVLEIIIVSDVVEGTPVDLDGESRHEHVEAKLSRRGREMLNVGEEIRSPKRKVIQVESEETQDYVREGRSRERSKEHGSGRSGRAELRTECDQCSAKADV